VLDELAPFLIRGRSNTSDGDRVAPMASQSALIGGYRSPKLEAQNGIEGRLNHSMRVPV
jgi:hypothetical protein